MCLLCVSIAEADNYPHRLAGANPASHITNNVGTRDRALKSKKAKGKSMLVTIKEVTTWQSRKTQT